MSTDLLKNIQSAFGSLAGCNNATTDALNLRMWKSASKHVMSTWYVTFGTNVNLGRIRGSQKC